MRAIFCAFAMGSLAATASAHHSFNGYSQEIRDYEGEIVDLKWRNPHILFTVRSVGEGGQEELRTMEAGSIYMFQRGGVGPEQLAVGTRVRVAARQSTRRASDYLATNLLLPQGRELLLTGSEPRFEAEEQLGRGYWVSDERRTEDARGDGRGIYRVWSVPQINRREYDVNMTEAALASREAWDPIDNFALKCEPEGMPRVMLTPHPYEFVDAGDQIVLRLEMYDQQRTIHMNRTEAPAGEPFSNLGYSVGAWENEALVVTTTNINWPHFDNSGTPQSEASEIVERFTLSEDETRLDYHITVTDPYAFTEPATVSGHMVAIGEDIELYNCQLYPEE